MKPGILLLAFAAAAFAQLSDDVRKRVDQVVENALADTAIPSASIAIVTDGRISYEHAYGLARLDPKLPAAPSMRYKIGSNSKQITSAAILLLVAEGKLSLDDRVSKYFPDLTRARDVTLRELLSHQSGYQDYYAIDFTPPFMTQPATAARILDTWARKPLDFEPGSQYQYSNTNYVIAGLIFEKVAGQPLMTFLRARVFEPLGMESPVDLDHDPWPASEPNGYTRFGLGPMRPANPEGPGWLMAAGELAMTAADLARWDISLMNGTILKPAQLKELTTEVPFSTGSGARYGLGVSVGSNNGKRIWSHTGGVSGFNSSNYIYPDDHISITVLTNGEGPAHSQIVRKLQPILLPSAADPDEARDHDRALGIFTGLQQGKLDRSLLTEDANAYFTAQAVADFTASLKPLGKPASFTQSSVSHRGGMTYRVYSAKAGGKTLSVQLYLMPDGKIDQYLVRPQAQ